MVFGLKKRLQLEKQSRLMRYVINTINSPHDIDGAVKQIILEIENKFGFSAIGIRLQSEEDFPYHAQSGFSKDFLAVENSLVTHDSLGCACRDEAGHIALECTCGLVLSGKTDAKLSLFTPGGSAWTNDSTALLKIPKDKDPRFKPRNKCVHDGYLSLCIVPIRDGIRILGVLQLNDRKKNKFTVELVKFFEDIGQLLGILIHTKYENERYRNLFQNTKSSIVLADVLTGIIVDVNRQAEILFGRTRTELIGMNRIKLHPPEKAEYYEDQFREHADCGSVQFAEGVIIRKDGTKVPVSIAASVFIINGKKKIQGIFQDLTEMKKLEKEMERKKGDLSVPQFVR